MLIDGSLSTILFKNYDKFNSIKVYLEQSWSSHIPVSTVLMFYLADSAYAAYTPTNLLQICQMKKFFYDNWVTYWSLGVKK